MSDAKHDPEFVSHGGYNKFVQSVQADARSWGFELRIRQGSEGAGGLQRAYFELFYDGKWHILGAETPFTPDDESRRAMIYPRLWVEIQHHAAGALVKS